LILVGAPDVAGDARDHVAFARASRAYLKWRNANSRDPKILDAERRNRARLRGETQRRLNPPPPAPSGGALAG
jgi:hypothetical protein